MRDRLQAFVTEILRDAEDDWIMVDSVIAYGWEAGGQEGDDPREVTVELIRFLLEEGLMRVGDLGESGFEAWTCSVDESVRKFVDGCEAYDWEPQGALWWLEITNKGRERIDRSA
ncbi:hypothetical protein [Streptomyces sp. WMMB 322]|uniref:hypothetical protein n=1 Tax=Streptomyces sp. WMMB 322 TaxID=1286821 RepID=UPI0008237F1D|nr:hypothetical protein [Streptomyces sp. WMMB 322]SCK35772.1 hypothetical protein H180DRAFT_02965 [Streptomyces sp. WMMB 322]